MLQHAQNFAKSDDSFCSFLSLTLNAINLNIHRTSSYAICDSYDYFYLSKVECSHRCRGAARSECQEGRPSLFMLVFPHVKKVLGPPTGPNMKDLEATDQPNIRD